MIEEIWNRREVHIEGGWVFYRREGIVVRGKVYNTKGREKGKREGMEICEGGRGMCCVMTFTSYSAYIQEC